MNKIDRLVTIPVVEKKAIQMSDNKIAKNLAGKAYGSQPTENIDTRIAVNITKSEKKAIEAFAHQNKQNDINELDTLSKVVRLAICEFRNKYNI